MSSAPNPGQAAAAAAPIAVFVGVTGISFAAFLLSKSFPWALAQALACGTAGAVLVNSIIRRELGHLLLEPSTSNPATSNVQPKEETVPSKNIWFLSDIVGPKGT